MKDQKAVAHTLEGGWGEGTVRRLIGPRQVCRGPAAGGWGALVLRLGLLWGLSKGLRVCRSK